MLMNYYLFQITTDGELLYLQADGGGGGDAQSHRHNNPCQSSAGAKGARKVANPAKTGGGGCGGDGDGGAGGGAAAEMPQGRAAEWFGGGSTPYDKVLQPTAVLW